MLPYAAHHHHNDVIASYVASNSSISLATTAHSDNQFSLKNKGIVVLLYF